MPSFLPARSRPKNGAARVVGQQPETHALRRQRVQVPSTQRARGPARALRPRADQRNRDRELRGAPRRRGRRRRGAGLPARGVAAVVLAAHARGLARRRDCAGRVALGGLDGRAEHAPAR